MKKFFIFLIGLGTGILIGLFISKYSDVNILNPLARKVSHNNHPLKKYSFSNLRKTEFPDSQIKIGNLIKSSPGFNSYLFSFTAEGKKVSGLLNIPIQTDYYPVVIMLRGYVDKEIYTTGIGTQKVGEALAEAGFITLALDFLGYGQSDPATVNSLEERFQTYTTTLTLLSSIKNLETALAEKGLTNITVNQNKIAFWGHSNGGHIALAVLAISGKDYPTSLWAPVSKPFPYSILYYTDEYSDQGKYLRKVVAQFEEDYNISLFSPPNYYNWIKAPIQLHQGTADASVPLSWSDNFKSRLTSLNKKIDYYIYEGSDHNLLPSGWNPAVEKTIIFFMQHFNSEP